MVCPCNLEPCEQLLDHRMEATVEAIPVLAAAVDEALHTMPILASLVNLCLEELVSNAILHGYQGAAGAIEISIDRCDNALEIHYCDNASPFNPFTEVPPPNLDASLEDRILGGLGIYLIRKMMDQIQSWHTPEGNRIHLFKCLSGQDLCCGKESPKLCPRVCPKITLQEDPC